MTVLVSMFAWIYARDRQHGSRYWLIGWIAIEIHFASSLLVTYHKIPGVLAGWLAYSTLLVTAACFHQSVSQVTLKAKVLYWGLLFTPALLYWTFLVFRVKPGAPYSLLLACIIASGSFFCLRAAVSRTERAFTCAQYAGIGLWVLCQPASPMAGMNYILFEAFAMTGWTYWRRYSRATPGVVLTSISFFLWGMVWPCAMAAARLGAHIPGDSVLWDLPKYFVAFGMIVTLFESQTAVLQCEVAERRKAEERALAASRSKSIFLASMSHEIRTPMNGIIGLTDLVLDSGLTQQQRQDLCMVKSSAESLLGVINDILDFSKIEAGKMECDSRPFALHEVIDETAGSLNFRARQKGLELVHEIAPDVPAVVLGDAGRLRQVLVNLIGNAIKFTATGEISVTVAREHSGAEGALQFTVADTGIGVPPEKLGSIFEPFTQADDSIHREFGGTGLGLAICAQLVRAMGGRIWAQPGPNGCGSAFHFTAILGAAECADLPKREHRTRARVRPLRILLAEDNFVNSTLAVRLLERDGHTVTVAVNGRTAVEAFRGQHFDLILMDVQMPEMDGFEATHRIRLEEAGTSRHIPIVAMTAHAMKGDAERCLAEGMDAYVAKPISPGRLIDVLAGFATETEHELRNLADLEDVPQT